MRVYYKQYYYYCTLVGERCGEDNTLPPTCEDCESYIGWKKSGLSITSYLKLPKPTPKLIEGIERITFKPGCYPTSTIVPYKKRSPDR